jgi:hypothetical protein
VNSVVNNENVGVPKGHPFFLLYSGCTPEIHMLIGNCRLSFTVRCWQVNPESRRQKVDKSIGKNRFCIMEY